MNAFFVAVFASLAALAVAAPSGIHGAGAVVSGPSGIVTSHGAIGPAGHGLGIGVGGLGLGLGGLGGYGGYGGYGHGVAIAAPVATAVVSGHGVGIGYGLGLGNGIGLGGLGGLGHGVGFGHGLGAITNGGGTIGVSAHGASVRGPHTAPVVVAGPAGKIVADGLWGPTANVGLGAHGGHGW